MIQGSSRFVYRLSNESFGDYFQQNFDQATSKLYLSYNIYKKLEELPNGENQANFLKQFVGEHPIVESLRKNMSVTFAETRVDIKNVDGIQLNISAFRNSNSKYKDAVLVLEDGSISYPSEQEQKGIYLCGAEVEKMSKSKLNVENPDDVVEKYGADTFRMYEMFLGPVEMSKPWDTKGIEGVHRFLKKLWRLFATDTGLIVTDETATAAELKVLHKTIKKIEEDTERFSFNTAVSAFMVCVNELTDLSCHKREVLQPLLILLTPFAPHISEELWHQLGNAGTVLDASFPKWEEKHLLETTKAYPISINGKITHHHCNGFSSNRRRSTTNSYG